MAITLAGVMVLAPLRNQVIEEQANLASKLRMSKALAVEDCMGVQRSINPEYGVNGSAGVVVGGAALPTAENTQPVQILPLPTSFLAHASIPMDSADQINGKKAAVNLIDRQLKVAANSIGFEESRAVFDGYCSAILADATVSGGAATITVGDPNGIRVNMVYDIYQSDGTTVRGSGRITAKTNNGDGTATCTISGLKDGLGLSGSTLAVSLHVADGLWIRGFQVPAAPARFVSLKDACASGDIYGKTVTGADWNGHSLFAGNAISLGHLRDLADAIADTSGQDPDVFVMGREIFQDWESLQSSNVRFMVGDVMDPLGKNGVSPMFRDKPIVVDSTCPVKSVFAWVQDAFTLGEYRKNGVAGNGKTAEVSQSTFDYLIKVYGSYQGIVDRRNGIGRLHGLTISAS